MKWCSTLLVIREINIKPQWDTIKHPSKQLNIKTDNTKCWQWCGHWNSHTVNLYDHLLLKLNICTPYNLSNLSSTLEYIFNRSVHIYASKGHCKSSHLQNLDYMSTKIDNNLNTDYKERKTKFFHWVEWQKEW